MAGENDGASGAQPQDSGQGGGSGSAGGASAARERDDDDAGGGSGDGDQGEGGEQRREPLSVEELDRRYRSVHRDLKATQRELRAERERNRSQPQGERRQARQEEDEDLDIPDVEEDPAGALKALAKLAKRARETGVEEERTQAERRKEADTVKYIARRMGEAEEDFRADHPDYNAAAKHFKDKLREDLEDQGYSGEALRRAMVREQLRLVGNAIQNGADPAELIYNRARKSGYRQKAADEQLDSEERGQQSQRTTRTPTGQRQGGFTTDQLLSAKGKDFDAIWEKYKKRQLGGRA